MHMMALEARRKLFGDTLSLDPAFFLKTRTGEVLSRLTTDTTLVQTVVGSSLSMGLRNVVMGVGALAALVITNPWVMTQVLGILVLVVLPSLYFGRRVRKLSRASQDRVADSSAIAAEVLNAIPVVQSYVQEGREARRFDHSTEQAFDTARKRTRVRALLVGFIITATFGALLWGLYQGTQAVAEGRISAGHLGQTVVFVIILVGAVAVLVEGAAGTLAAFCTLAPGKRASARWRSSQVTAKLTTMAQSLAMRGSSPAALAPPTISMVTPNPISAEMTNIAFCLVRAMPPSAT